MPTNNEDRQDFNCRGCFKFEGCDKALKPQALHHVNLQRAPNAEKYHICHSVFSERVERPADPKKTRRQFGETAIQY